MPGGSIHHCNVLGLGMNLDRRFQQSCVVDIRQNTRNDGTERQSLDLWSWDPGKNDGGLRKKRFTIFSDKM